MIIASPALGARQWPENARSKLYDPGFGHRFRKASAPATEAGLPTGESA
jgi:precorrin-4/cobalt-precorrin-4 C11-methyltransferase